MILDSLDNLQKYVALNVRLQQVVDFIAKTNLEAHETGKVELDGKDVFANFCLAQGKTKETARLESHDVMLDVQIPLSHAETMGWTPRERLERMPYDAANDISFYEGRAEQYVTVHPGEFAIFFPQDGHAPCITDEKEIWKVIFKVKTSPVPSKGEVREV